MIVWLDFSFMVGYEDLVMWFGDDERKRGKKMQGARMGKEHERHVSRDVLNI